MNNQNRPAELAMIDVVILCGGLGTRLREAIPDRPKALAPVGGRPFLDILVEDLIRQGFRRFILCVGHLKGQIIDRYKARNDAEFLFSLESSPLGTGGALRNALPLIRSHPVLVVNGDSYCCVEYRNLLQFHSERSAAATLVLTEPEKRRDGGLVRVDETHRILSFAEKSGPPGFRGLISAGIYLLQIDAIGLKSLVPPFSLEHDVFPSLVNSKLCFGFIIAGPLVDIGTPERYRKADEDRLGDYFIDR